MINPFTLYSKVKSIQETVMVPLYGSNPGYMKIDHNILLKITGFTIQNNAAFIHEICNSKFIAAVFKVVKLIGAAPQLTEEDFDRFTNYVKDGGLEAMFKMLEADDKFKVFSEELSVLPKRVRDNAELMLTKSKVLHMDFVREYLDTSEKPVSSTAVTNMQLTDAFIGKLVKLARE